MVRGGIRGRTGSVRRPGGGPPPGKQLHQSLTDLPPRAGPLKVSGSSVDEGPLAAAARLGRCKGNPGQPGTDVHDRGRPLQAPPRRKWCTSRTGAANVDPLISPVALHREPLATREVHDLLSIVTPGRPSPPSPSHPLPESPRPASGSRRHDRDQPRVQGGGLLDLASTPAVDHHRSCRPSVQTLGQGQPDSGTSSGTRQRDPASSMGVSRGGAGWASSDQLATRNRLPRDRKLVPFVGRKLPSRMPVIPRSNCSIAMSLDLLGDRWKPLWSCVDNPFRVYRDIPSLKTVRRGIAKPTS